MGSRCAQSLTIVLALLALSLAGQTAVGDPRELPLLKPGNHLGVVVAFEQLPAAVQEQVHQYWEEALARGMSVARVHSDWSALEERSGQFDKARIEHQMQAFHEDGLQFMVTISTLDSGELTLPPDLEDPEDDGRLADGINIDDPKVVQRYLALLDSVVPMMGENGGLLLSVANEPDCACHAVMRRAAVLRDRGTGLSAF